jgi:hypothetical protein
MSQAEQGVTFFFVSPNEDQEKQDFLGALANENTRRVFRLLLGVSNALGPSYAQDAHSTEYNEGLRAVGLWLAAKIEKAAPGQLAALMRESADDYAAFHAVNMGKKHD